MSTLWVINDGASYTANPLALGFAETNCGPDMLCRGETDYANRIAAFRVHIAAVDGNWSKVVRSQEAVVKTIESSVGLNKAGGVSDDGIVRFDGLEYRQAGSKHWLPFGAQESRFARGEIFS